MFRTDSLSIIRSISLYTQQQHMSYSLAYSLRPASAWNIATYRHHITRMHLLPLTMERKLLYWQNILHSLRNILPSYYFNPLKAELNPICCLLALLGAHHFLHVSRIRVNLLIFNCNVTQHFIYNVFYISLQHIYIFTSNFTHPCNFSLTYTVAVYAVLSFW